MKKSQADTLALIFARDIIKTNTNPNPTVKLLTEANAVAIGNFVKKLSSQFEKLEDHPSIHDVIGAFTIDSATTPLNKQAK